MTVTITIANKTGTINVPVTNQAVITSDTGLKLIDWACISHPSINFTVTTDRRTIRFTPSTNAVYTFTVTVTDNNNVKTAKSFTITVGGTTPPPITCPPGQHLENGVCVPDVITPPPNPTPAPGTLIYDSNINIDWASLGGQIKRVDDTYGNIGANGKGFHMNASGSPRMFLNPATKELTLEHDGKYGRAYFAVTNYNARLECDFKLDSCSNNASFKIRNRHQVNEEGGFNVTDEHRQGGIGASAHCNEIGNQVEVVHGTNTLDKSKSISLQAGKWYTIKFSVKDVDANTLRETTEIVGVGTAEYNIDPPKQFFYKSDFDTWSEFWVRLNADNGGKLMLKNIKMYAL